MKDVLKPDHDDHFLLRWLRGTLTFTVNLSKCRSRGGGGGGGGQGVRTLTPGKPQIIWVSIGNKKLDPP